MRKITSFLALIAIFYATYKLYEQPLTEKAAVKFGVTLPLSGENSDAGISSQNAINLALKKWSTRNTKYKYLVFYLDDKGVSSKGLLNAQNLIRSQKAKAVISQNTSVSEYVSQLTEKTHILHFSCSEDNKVAEGKYNFNYPPSKTINDSFRQEFLEATGQEPAPCAASLYDAVDFMIMAYETTPPQRGEKLPANDEVINNLRKIQNHQGAAGIASINNEGIVGSEH